jgi:hypothetical protein
MDDVGVARHLALQSAYGGNQFVGNHSQSLLQQPWLNCEACVGEIVAIAECLDAQRTSIVVAIVVEEPLERSSGSMAGPGLSRVLSSGAGADRDGEDDLPKTAA